MTDNAFSQAVHEKPGSAAELYLYQAIACYKLWAVYLLFRSRVFFFFCFIWHYCTPALPKYRSLFYSQQSHFNRSDALLAIPPDTSVWDVLWVYSLLQLSVRTGSARDWNGAVWERQRVKDKKRRKGRFVRMWQLTVCWSMKQLFARDWPVSNTI